MTTQTASIAENFPAEISAERYTVRIAQTQREIESALRLRHEVFNVELAGLKETKESGELEFDRFDFYCKHLIVVETRTRKTVGTYRLNTLETAGTTSGFYSYGAFSIENLPPKVLADSIEIGRACIAREHRSTRVLFFCGKAWQTTLKKPASVIFSAAARFLPKIRRSAKKPSGS